MTTQTALAPALIPAQPAVANVADAVVSYYAEATADYRFWSPDNLNMHFGYGSLHNAFDREAMLEAMNTKVLDTLDAPDREGIRVGDLGCGTGATSRFAASRTRHTRFVGVTIAPEHVRRAQLMNEQHPARDRLEVLRADYTATPLATASLDGAYAIESACHGPGTDKSPLIAEAARLLKPGAKFVVADGFRIDGGKPLGRISGAAYERLCQSWALTGLADLDGFKAALARHGFEDIRVEDISWRVALSVMHVPLVSLAFVLTCLRRGDRLEGWRLSNMLASLLTMLVGLMRWRFRYCIVTATRRNDARGAPALTGRAAHGTGDGRLENM